MHPVKQTIDPIDSAKLGATSAPLRAIADLGGPATVPFFGNMLQVDRNRVHQDIEALCKVHGRFFKLNFAGRTLLVVADHEASARILKDRPAGFQRSSQLNVAASSMGMDLGLFSAEGDAWSKQRRMVMASFAPQRIRAYFPAMLAVVTRLEKRWHKAATQGVSIDLQADLMRYTIDTITGLAFGHNVNSLEADGDVIQRHLDEIFPALFGRLFSILPYWKLIKLPSDRRAERSVAEVNKAIDQFIVNARKRIAQDPTRRDNPTDLLEAFVVAAESEGEQLTDADVKGNVLTMLLAGEDTTANTLAWLIYLLKQNPQTLAKAREEVMRVVPGGLADFTTESMAELDYLEACAQEAMRLKPVAPFLPVEAKKDTIVGDIAVPAGTLVWNVLRHDSMSDKHVSDPDAFKPERWLIENNGLKHLSTPFGSGPRVCPGRYLALLEIKMAMAMLLHSFEIDSVDTPDGQPARELMAFTMGPVGLTMRLRAAQAAN